MKKVELEAKILELEKKIKELEARPTTYCLGHTCHCNHFNYPIYPNTHPWYIGTPYTISSGAIATIPINPLNLQVTTWSDGTNSGTNTYQVTDLKEVNCGGNHPL